MADTPASQQNTAIAQRIQEKFDAYLLGLIFTILGLSIQTAKFGTSPTADALEILSWLLLLVAGLAGLSRLEWAPEMYRLFGLQQEKDELGRAVQLASLKGTTEVYVAPLGKSVPADQYVAEAKESVATVEAALKPLQRKGFIKYRVMKVAFVLGLFSLMCARALLPVRGIFHAWTAH
jgi:NhaP-type Na+/H+ or K+/H+ antiporter